MRGSLAGRRVAVVGATGFIGSHLTERLVWGGAAVLAVARTADRLGTARCVPDEPATHVRDCAARHQPVRLMSGSQTRDVLYVDDAVAAVRNAWTRTALAARGNGPARHGMGGRWYSGFRVFRYSHWRPEAQTARSRG